MVVTTTLVHQQLAGELAMAECAACGTPVVASDSLCASCGAGFQSAQGTSASSGQTPTRNGTVKAPPRMNGRTEPL